MSIDDPKNEVTPHTPPLVPTKALCLSVEDVMRRVGYVRLIREKVMKQGIHYMVIPGTKHPTLTKAGAEVLALAFQLCTQVETTIVDHPDDHKEYRVIVNLVNQAGVIIGQGIGSSTTMESKHRYRARKTTCPHCKEETVNRSNDGSGFYCWAKKGGCGAKFGPDDKAITEQKLGKIENPDPADVHNTCWKMAKKRAFVDATLTATAASEHFTQDLEEDAPPPTPPKDPLLQQGPLANKQQYQPRPRAGAPEPSRADPVMQGGAPPSQQQPQGGGFDPSCDHTPPPDTMDPFYDEPPRNDISGSQEPGDLAGWDNIPPYDTPPTDPPAAGPDHFDGDPPPGRDPFEGAPPVAPPPVFLRVTGPTKENKESIKTLGGFAYDPTSHGWVKTVPVNEADRAARIVKTIDGRLLISIIDSETGKIVTTL